jgi:hypothetical protein
MAAKRLKKSQPRAQEVENEWNDLALHATPLRFGILHEFCFPGNGERLKIV